MCNSTKGKFTHWIFHNLQYKSEAIPFVVIFAEDNPISIGSYASWLPNAEFNVIPCLSSNVTYFPSYTQIFYAMQVTFLERQKRNLLGHNLRTKVL